MPTIRSFSNAFEVSDYTQELQIVPNKWTLLNDVGLFTPEYLSTYTASFEESNQTIALIADQYRGAKPQANLDDTRKIHSYYVPFFPIVDAITVADVQGKRAYGSVDAAETEAGVMARKMARISRAMDDTLELARFKTLTTLAAYSPSGTVSANFATDFGITQKVVDFNLDSAGTDVIAKVEEVIAHIQDNSNGATVNGVVCYASNEFFAALIGHAKVQAAYTYFQATEGQMIQRNRAGGNNNSMYREFSYGGIRFIEVRGSIGGVRLVPANEAVFVPIGTDDVFTSFFAPANKLDYANTVAEPRYLWSWKDPKGDGIDIEGQFSVLNIIKRPALVVKGTLT